MLMVCNIFLNIFPNIVGRSSAWTASSYRQLNLTRSSFGIRLFLPSDTMDAIQRVLYKYTVYLEPSSSIRPRLFKIEPQCADIPPLKHSPSSSVSSQSLLVVCLNGSRRSTCTLLQVSSPTFRRPPTDYSRASPLPSLLSRSHAVNTRCQRPQTAPRGIGPCQGFGRRARWKYSDRHLLCV